MKQRMLSQPRSLGRGENKWQGKDCIQDDSEDSDEVGENKMILSQDISRDDLTELYRIVMNRYGMNGPEDELEK
ncbi:hypothetical protein Tco_0283809, partial [Tanacetum coccineum]